MIAESFWTQGVMLASPSKNINPDLETAITALESGGQHWYELKFDGVRALFFVDDGEVKIINRRGADITFRYPELVSHFMTCMPSGQHVFDGEIICYGDDGKPDFARIHRRDAQANVRSVGPLVAEMPATFMAFDVLLNGGDDTRGMPYVARATMLDDVAAKHWAGARLEVGVRTPNASALWQFVKNEGMEGLIAKKIGAPYRGGRSPHWIKLKVAFEASFVVIGYTAGRGRRANGIGALCLAVIGPDGPIECGEVGTGFTDAELDRLKPLLDAKEVIVVSVEFANVVGESGKLRFPSYRGQRMDQTWQDCTVDQLDAVPRY